MKVYELYEGCGQGDCRATGRLYKTLDRLVKDVEDRNEGDDVTVKGPSGYFGDVATIEVQNPYFSYRRWIYYAMEQDVIE